MAAWTLGLVAACAGEDPVRSLPLPPCGDPVTGEWDARSVDPGLTGPHAFASTLVRLADGRLAVGGSFEAAVGLPVRNVAAWDGARWAPLGDGLPGIVWGLARDEADTLWAIGSADLHERGTDYVARWDGTAWAMVIDDGDGIRGITTIAQGVAVWGSFATLGSLEARALAVWDGGAWSAPTLDVSDVTTLARTPDGFCVGGRLREGTALRDGATCWDGAAWTALGPASPHVRLTALTRGPDERWWAGASLQSAEATVTGLAYLADGGTWQLVDRLHDVGGFFPAPAIHAIAFEEDSVVIAGRFIAVGAAPVRAAGIARWRPAAGWSALGGGGVVPRDQVVHAMLTEGRRLHVAGGFAGANATIARGVATIEEDHTVTPWTGTIAALSPYASITDLAASRRGLVVGRAIFIDDLGPTSAAVFDGGWHALPGAPPGGEGVSVAVLADESIVLSGEFLERFDGRTWRRIVDGPARRVPLLAEAGGGFYFAYEDGVGATEVMRWRDGALRSFGFVKLALDAEGGHRSLAVVKLVAFEGELLALVEDQDGQRGVVIRRDEVWQLIPDGPPEIASVAVTAGVGLVVASRHGNVSAWDGAVWRVLRPRAASALASCEGGLFAAEPGFDGAAATSSLGFFDGATWHALGAARHGWISAIEPTAGGVYVVDPTGSQPVLQRWVSP
ncbi:MAG: hypothetical protein M3680_22835 [Myxococcota bacterium]|nr:hypothetical protein [Myxococcota bacterium]